MAFKDASTEYKCGRSDCNNMRKYFRMMESRRERDAFIDPGAGDDYEDITRFNRICEVCEKKTRGSIIGVIQSYCFIFFL